jgi:hypothetical protein
LLVKHGVFPVTFRRLKTCHFFNFIFSHKGGAMGNVLVMFQADSEDTEQLALAVSVGAVEAEASIRLRRLAAPSAVEMGHKGYGKLQAADLLWANIVVVGLEAATPKTEELGGLISLLGEANPGELNGKQAWTFSQEGLTATRSEAQIFVESALQAAGIAVLSMEVLVPRDSDSIGRMKKAGRLSTG